jgi:hypothetical protein
MPVSNEDLMEKLNKIDSMLQNISTEEKKIESEEEKELKELDETVNLEFDNPEDWRKYIWETCPFKQEKSEGEEIDFFCKKSNSACRFEKCPLNKKL